MNNILIAIISLIGTMLGTFGGIITSSKLTNFRLERLENEVKEHNNFARRIPVLEEQIKTLFHKFDYMEEKDDVSKHLH